MILGAVYTISFALLKLLATLVVGPQPDITMEAMQNDPQARMQLTEYMVLYMMFVGVCSLPVILAFWYAPALVVWHKMKPVQALFSSWVAVWRNKGPFLIYGMGWLILALGFSSVILVLLTLLGLPAVLLGVVQVLIMAVIMGATLATIYPSYEAVLEGKQEAPLDPWNPGKRGDDN